MSILLNGVDLDNVLLGTAGIDEVIFNGTSVYTSAPAWDSRGLQYNSWSTIAWYIKNGKTSGKINVGDTKTVQFSACSQLSNLGNKTVTFRVAAINDGSSLSTYYPANTVDFIADSTVVTVYMVGSASDKGWNDIGGSTFSGYCVRRVCQELIPTIIPSDLNSVIINKNHMVRETGTGSNFVQATDKIWIPSYCEVFDSAGSYSLYNTEKQYRKQYPIFPDANSRKRTGGAWYTCSCKVSDNKSVWYGLNSNGAAQDQYGNTQSWGIVPGFRIG